MSNNLNNTRSGNIKLASADIGKEAEISSLRLAAAISPISPCVQSGSTADINKEAEPVPGGGPCVQHKL